MVWIFLCFFLPVPDFYCLKKQQPGTKSLLLEHEQTPDSKTSEHKHNEQVQKFVTF
jgi:hypothetical protein